MRYAIGIVVGPGDQPLVVDRRCPGSLVLAGSGAWRIEHLQRTAAGAQKTMKHIVAIDRLADDRVARVRKTNEKSDVATFPILSDTTSPTAATQVRNCSDGVCRCGPDLLFDGDRLY